MMINRITITAVLTLAVAANVMPGMASDPVFTSEQLRVIKAMIAEERERLREEVRQEVLVEMQQEKAETAASRASNATRSSAASYTGSGARSNVVDVFFDNTGGATIDRVLSAPPSNDKETGVGFELSTMTENNRASIKLKRTRSSTTVADPVGPPGSKKGEFSSYSLSASAPVTKDGNYTNVATLDGFANAFELSGSYSKHIVPGRRSGHLTSNNEFTPEFIEFCRKLGLDPTGESGCDSGTVKEKLEALEQIAEYPKYKELFFDPKKPVMMAYGVHGKVGYESFDYYDMTNLDKLKTEHTPWGVGVHVGFIPPSSTTLFAVSADFQESYKATKTSTACPASGAEIVSCTTGSFGEPNKKEKHLISAELRSLFSDVPIFDDVALSLKVTRDLKNDETGVDIPIYLFNGGKGNLNGGVRAGWTNTDDLTFGVFVGSDFTFDN